MTRTTRISSLILACLTTLPALADTAAIHAGLGLWQSEPDGELYNYNFDELNYGSHENGSAFLAIEHPVPLIPNFRVQMNKLKHSGAISMQGVTFESETALGSVDPIAYYELLDNWISFDLGLGVRHFDGDSTLLIGNAQQFRRAFDTYAPNLYADANFDLPFTGWSVGAALQYGSFDDTEFGEYSARVSYMFDGVVDVGAELGLKSLDVKRIDGLDLEANYTGPYLTLKASF